MKIALISAKGPLYRHQTGIFRKSLRAAPLTLTTLAALVPDSLSASVKIYDEGIEHLPKCLEADIVGMTVITGSAPRTYELAQRFRAEGKKVILGGPHVTLLPDEAQQHADAIVVGYAEESWPRLLKDYSQGCLQKRYEMSPDFSLDNPGPIPRRDLIRKKDYSTVHTFEATRGCVHQCEFCVVPSAWGGGPYQKPVSHVIDEIRQFGSKRLIFYDLNLIANRNYAKELFAALISLKIKWFGLATTVIGEDDELLELAVRSGCKGLLIGFESITEASLSNMNKRFNSPQKYAKLIQKLRSHGIVLNGTFVFGSDNDSLNTFAEVQDFVLTHHIDLPRFSILTPFPNTPLFNRLENVGRILSRDWSLYDGQHVVFQPHNMTVPELMQGHEEVWRNVYSYRNIWSRMINHLGDLLPLKPIILSANLDYRFYANNLKRFYTCTGGVV